MHGPASRSVGMPAGCVRPIAVLALVLIVLVGCATSDTQTTEPGAGQATGEPLAETAPPALIEAPSGGPFSLLVGPDPDSRTGGITLTLTMRTDDGRAADVELMRDGAIVFYGGKAAVLRGLSKREEETTTLTPSDVELGVVLGLMSRAGWVDAADVPPTLRSAEGVETTIEERLESPTSSVRTQTAPDEPARFRVRVRTPSAGGERLRFEASEGSPAWELVDYLSELVVRQRFPDLGGSTP